MAQILKLDEAADRSFFSESSCAFGVFDGFHIGHQALIGFAVEDAHARGEKAVALTFSIDPDELFRSDELKKLSGNAERIERLAASGVDYVAVLPFDRAFAGKSPEEFLAWTFGSFVPKSIHVGVNFRFGAKASGTESTLRKWGMVHACRVCVHELTCAAGEPVSATRIRGLLAQGKIEEANELLGHRYAVSGTVVSGRGEGAQMGIRTANLDIPQALHVLGDGVYAAYAIVDGARYKAAVNMGVAATFADRATANCEAHLLDFSGDIYGECIELEFVAWLRPMKKFDDVDELIAAITSNISWVRDNL